MNAKKYKVDTKGIRAMTMRMERDFCRPLIANVIVG
jgi:hypothetical protein